MFSIESHHIAVSSTAEATERLQSLLASSCLRSANEPQLSLQQHSISELRLADITGFYPESRHVQLMISGTLFGVDHET